MAVVFLVVFPVACDATASGDYPTELKLVDAQGTRTSPGHILITGFVHNTGTFAAGDIVLEAYAYSASGAVVDSHLGTTDDAVVQPGVTSTFAIELLDPDDKATRTEVQLTSYSGQKP